MGENVCWYRRGLDWGNGSEGAEQKLAKEPDCARRTPNAERRTPNGERRTAKVKGFFA
jgi:hypothetical protein